MLAENPTLSGALAVQGQQAPSIDEILEKYPSFMAGYLPAGVRDELPLVRNMQAASLFDMPGEIVERIQNINKDYRNFYDPLNPVQRAAGVTGWGYDPFTGQERSATSLSELLGRAGWAGDVETRSIPYRSIPEDLMVPEEDRKDKLFPRSNLDLAMQFGVGNAFWPFPVNPESAERMAVQEEERYSKKKRRRKRPYTGF